MEYENSFTKDLHMLEMVIMCTCSACHINKACAWAFNFCVFQL